MSLLRVLSRVPEGLVNVVERSTLILSFRRDPNGAIHRSESDLPKRFRARLLRNRLADDAAPALVFGQDGLSSVTKSVNSGSLAVQSFSLMRPCFR